MSNSTQDEPLIIGQRWGVISLGQEYTCVSKMLRKKIVCQSLNYFFVFFFCNCSSTVHPLSQNLMRFDFVDYKIFCGGHFYAKKLHLVDFVNSYCFRENYPKRFLFPVDLKILLKCVFKKYILLRYKSLIHFI